MTIRSISTPTSAALRKPTGMAASRYQSSAPGKWARKTLCIAQAE
ncbi:MAG: hypothetical protein AW07_01222 [Candidatus Accumulibacter sp. SK-11]|nr:MAG: hypothetical protein AW07_01222 [Candidatus Accumulibacter sp. SK-11]